MTPKEQTLETLAVYNYFGCSGPITQTQINLFKTRKQQMDNIEIKNEVMLTEEQVAALKAGQEVAVNVTVDLTEPTAPAV